MVVSSALCFSVRADGMTFRRWRMGAVEIEITESLIKIRLCGGGWFGLSTATMTTTMMMTTRFSRTGTSYPGTGRSRGSTSERSSKSG